MTDFSPLDSALYESTPEKIAASLRYLRKADAVMAALMPLSASTPAPPAAAVPDCLPQPGESEYVGDAGPVTDADFAELPAALAEPLFLLHTGAVYGGERDDWEIEANSGEAVDAYCDANPGKTIGLYLAAPAQQPAANKESTND